MTPEERLCSRRWRLFNSIWVLWSILSFGLLASVGYFYVAIKTKKSPWFAVAAGWLVVNIGWIVMSTQVDTGTKGNPSQSTGSNILGIWLFIMWGGSSVMAYFLNREWLRWRAVHPRGQDAWYKSGTAPSAPQDAPPPPASQHLGPFTQPQPTPAHSAPVLPPEGGGQNWPPTSVPTGPTIMDRAPLTSSQMTHHDAQQDLVDINHAAPSELVAVGLSPAQAQQILTARARTGRFGSTDQIMTEAGIPPHVFVSVRDRLTCNTLEQPDGAPTGRVLDL